MRGPARRVSFAPAHALFRHMTVFENVAFGLRVRANARPPEADINPVMELLLRCSSRNRRPPARPPLSGGRAPARGPARRPWSRALPRRAVRLLTRRCARIAPLTSTTRSKSPALRDPRQGGGWRSRTAWWCEPGQGRADQQVFRCPATAFVMNFLPSTSFTAAESARSSARSRWTIRAPGRASAGGTRAARARVTHRRRTAACERPSAVHSAGGGQARGGRRRVHLLRWT